MKRGGSGIANFDVSSGSVVGPVVVGLVAGVRWARSGIINLQGAAGRTGDAGTGLAVGP